MKPRALYVGYLECRQLHISSELLIFIFPSIATDGKARYELMEKLMENCENHARILGAGICSQVTKLYDRTKDRTQIIRDHNTTSRNPMVNGQTPE
jgi:hypothetical protein